VSRVELQQYPAETIARHAEEICSISLHLAESLDVVANLGDSDNGLYGLAWLMKRSLVEVEKLAGQIADDAKQREIDSEEMERDAERRAAIAPVVVSKRKAARS
jgi:hypothetical protein